MSSGTSQPEPGVSDLPAPSETFPTVSLDGPRLTPQQYIYFYSPDEWEQFVLEWATAVDEDYVKLKRLGGPDDGGVDIAAFKSTSGFEGSWDCYQAKHYEKALAPAQAFAEMLKIFLNVHRGRYCLPDRYSFMAPRGCGQSLSRLLSSPTAHREEFIRQLTGESALGSSLGKDEHEAVVELASATSFEVFDAAEIHEVIDVHRKTRFHVARFGGRLDDRPDATLPPDEIAEVEATYVAALVDVYAETRPGEVVSVQSALADPTTGDHLRRQRVAFYSAESLRVYARDAVPAGTFDALQDDVFDGVIEMAEAGHETGMHRLNAVMAASAGLDLSSHALITVANQRDRKGICHQLANDSRVAWVRERSCLPS
jgi:hypothetical protein